MAINLVEGESKINYPAASEMEAALKSSLVGEKALQTATREVDSSYGGYGVVASYETDIAGITKTICELFYFPVVEKYYPDKYPLTFVALSSFPWDILSNSSRQSM